MLDRRLARTFLQLVLEILSQCHRQQVLVLSELGGHLLSPGQRQPAPSASATCCVRQAGQRVLAIWDASVLEKPESLELEGLCPVRSAKAARRVADHGAWFSLAACFGSGDAGSSRGSQVGSFPPSGRAHYLLIPLDMSYH